MRIKKLNKALIHVLVLCFFTGKMSAQTYSSNPSSTFAFTIGLTNTNLVNDTLGLESGVLYNGGFIYSLMLNNKLNIAVEALYTGKGLKKDSPIQHQPRIDKS